MLLTSWIRALRQSFTRRRLGLVRRKRAEFIQQTARQVRLAEVLEERTLLSIKPLVIDINTVTGTNVFTSTASTPGINITNSTLDPNNDGISDYDDLVIGVSESSTFDRTFITGAGIGIRINLSNLTGLNHITIDNVVISAGAGLQGVSVTLDNVALQSLAVDQTTISPTSGTLASGLDINLKNMNLTTGVDVSIQNSSIRTGSASANGVNVTLESVSQAVHVGELTLTDSTVEGFNVATSANSTLYATIDQVSARNNRIQDGSANPAARGMTYTLNRTNVGDLRVEDNLNLRNVAVITTDSPLNSVSISDNVNFDVRGFVATDTIRDAIRINATSTNAVGTQRSDVQNLRIAGNTITGLLTNTATVNGIVLNLTDSNLGNYSEASAGATIVDNVIQNLSSNTGSASAISINATATAAFVAGNLNRPLLLDFNGDGTANDLNGISDNQITANNGRGIVVATQANTTFLADIRDNVINGGAAGNRREGVSLTFTDRPSNAAFDSFDLTFTGNSVNNSAGTAVGVRLQNTAVGSFVIQDNEIINTRDAITSTPNALSVILEGTSSNQEATNLLRKSFISDNFIGLTRPTSTTPSVAASNNANGIFINTQEQSEIQDLQIQGNSIQNNGSNDLQAGLLFLREDQSTLRTVNPEVGQSRAVTIADNTIGLNRNGIFIDARNGSVDLLDFEIRDNFIGTDSTGADIGNSNDGINLRAQADARLLADIDNNQIRFNNEDGIDANDVFANFTTDKRQVGGTWINNTISDNSRNGILLTGRHGLSDEATGINTPLVIGLEGQGNILENNGGNGIRIYGPLAGTTNSIRSTANGEVSITNNLIQGNSGAGLASHAGMNAGIFVRSALEKLDIRHNQIEANTGKGIDLEVVHGIPTLPTNNGLPGSVQATIRDNVITSQISGTEDGDGIELSGFETLFATIGNRADNAALNRMDVLALNNFIDSNEGRGVDVLNIGNGTMQLRFGDDTQQGQNTIVGNELDGFRVINTGDTTQPQDGVPTAAQPLGTPAPRQTNEAAYSPDIMLDVARNTIRDNGIGLPAPVQQGGVSQVNGSGLVVLAAGVGMGSGALSGGENTFAATFPNEVGANSGNPLDGNGRVNLRVTNNAFEGNFGNDVSIIPYIAVIPPQTQVAGAGGDWPDDLSRFFISSMFLDPLVRVNTVFTGNTGNGIDVIRVAPDYTNDERNFKSRISNPAGGPFGSATRPRNATRLASDGRPFAATPGFSFVYPGIDFPFRQSGDGTLTTQPTTLRVEAGFDRSGTTQGFSFFDPAAPGPGSDDNFDDPITAIVNGRVDTIWDTVALGSFTYPNVDTPTTLTADVVDFATPRGSSPGVVTIAFSEYVTNVDITDFRLLRNGVVVLLESAPGIPLAVSPVGASQDPNNPGAFSQFTIDLTAVTSVAGDYELQVLAVDSSNPTFSAIRDVHLQFNNQGNTLVRVIDGDGILQDYAVNHQFTVDTSRPNATISPVTPDPRNSAAGIVTVTFDEDVTGVDIADFALYRTVGVTTEPVLLGSITVVQVSASQYTLNLNQLSGAPGNYELRMVSTDANTPVLDLAGNLVAENIGVGIATSDTWSVDTTLPFVMSIADALPPDIEIDSPRNAHPGSVIVNFSEDVTGVDVSDFSLQRTNPNGTVTLIDLSTFTLFSLSASQYELNLLPLTADAGTYKLTLNPLNSGIFDLAGNAFLTTATASWLLDIDAPLADIVDVLPDPRQTPVDALNVLFNEAVSGVNLADASAQFVLAYDDGTSATAGSISDATNSGPIVITSMGHGLANGEQITVYGVLGNTAANGVFTVQNVTVNTFELAGSFGNGLYSSGGRWARTVSLAGLTVAMETNTRYVLDLSSVTLDQGTYIVSLLANSGITDTAGTDLGPAADQFNVAAQDIWINGPDAVPTGAITPITTPRGTNAGLITVTFSEPLAKIGGNSPVNSADFQLTRTVGMTTTTITLTSVPITQTGPTTYTLDLSGAGLTDIDGNYTLRLLNTDATTPLRDLSSNLLSEDSDPLTPAGVASQIVWVKDSSLSGPQVTSFRDVQRNNALGSITKLREVQTLEINFSVNVTGIDLTDASKNFLLTRQATGGQPIPVSLDGVAVQQVTASQYRINLSALTGTDGTYRFTVLANGLITDTAMTPVELKNPQTATWVKDGVLRPSASAADSVDTAQGNEVVGSGSNYSLRQAIQEANALAGDDVIELGAGTYILSLAGVQEDFAARGDLDIRQNLVIRGKGVGVTIIDATALFNQATATNRDRLFQILSGVTVTIQGVTLQKGAVTGSEDGGAIRNSGDLTILDSEIKDSTAQDSGGAINNTGVLRIHNTTIANNVAGTTGGGIRNAGTMTVTNSTLSGNRAASHGGALINISTFTATLEGVTVSGNTSTSGAGGGIRNDGILTLINDTIASNRSRSVGAGISRNLGTVQIGNTIVTDNQLTTNAFNDVAGAFVSLGGNIIRTLGTATGFTGPQDQLNVNPNLQPLANYGGPTQTHALLAGSLAIDAGISGLRSIDTFDLDGDGDITELTPVDQRGALRVLDGPAAGNSIDVGAVEFGTFFVNTTADTPDINPGDGLAEDGLQQTSLRAAVMESNALAGESAIMLDGAVYLLNRLAPDTTPPTITSIAGVPTTPYTTGAVGLVTITFSEEVGGVDVTDFTLTRQTTSAGAPTTLTLTAAMFTKISNTQYTLNLTTLTGTNGLYRLTVNNNGTIRNADGLTLAASDSVIFVRGTDIFAPTVTIVPVTDTFPNAGVVTVVFNERINAASISKSHFTLTRDTGTGPVNVDLATVSAVSLTVNQDSNFNGRSVVEIDLSSVTDVDGIYVLTLIPTFNANTIRDVATTPNNLVGPIAPITWTKSPVVQFVPVAPDPRVGAVTTVTLEFSEAISGVQLTDFVATYDDGSGDPPLTIDLSAAVLTPVSPVSTPFGQAAQKWTLTFSNDEFARDGNYTLDFTGAALLTVAGNPFAATTALQETWTIGEDAAAIGDLDVVVGAERVQIFGKGKDDSTTVLGTAQARTVIDGNMTDRLFDFTVGSNVAITGVEMIHGRVVLERSGGAIRNFGALTINDSDVGTINGTTVQGNFADGNGGAIYNAAPFGALAPVTGDLQVAATAAAATLTLTSVAGFPNTGTFVIQIDSEQMQVTVVNAAANQFTVTRGFNGTVAAAHAAGSTVTLLASTTINRSNLMYNIAGSVTSDSPFGKGGAIYNESGAIVINDGTYAFNGATTDGGAIYNGNNATATLLSATLTSNNAGRDGGAIYNNDTAILTVDTSTLTNNRADVTVNGVSADGDGDGGAIYNETSATLFLDDSLLQNNMARNGGALYNDDGTLVLNRDTFGVNSALENGGAIFNTAGGNITLNQGLFTTNSASDNGGAIQNYGTLTILDVAGTGTQFLSNEAGTDTRAGDSDDGKGGAIFNQDGTVTVSSAVFTLNRSHGDAGVIYSDGDGTLTITRSTFSRNRADGNGGVLYNNDFSQLTIDEVTFSNNVAVGDGGAIYNNSEFSSGSTLSLTIDDSTFNDNSADRGGAIFNTEFGGLTLTNSTLSANLATSSGGGLANFGTADLLNDTLYLNDVSAGGSGAGIANNAGGTPPFGLMTLRNTIVAGGTNAADVEDGAIPFGGVSFIDGGHNLIEDVGTVTAFNDPFNANILGQNPQLDTLRDNGGPTFTHALLFGSPARDAGDNFNTTTGDQRGFNRIFDGDGNGVSTIDIGSFESGFVVNSFLDTVDQNPGDGINADANGQSTLRTAIMEANARPGEDTIILGPGIFTLTLRGRDEDFRLNSAGNIVSTSETGDLDILDDLNIIGAGTDLTFIDAAQIDRIFQVFPNVILNLSNLTLRNGHATSTGFGGAVFNQGETKLDNVLILDSTAGRGGGVYNDAAGTLEVEDTLFRGNLAVQQGGAIYNDGDLTVTRTDIGAFSRLASTVSAAATTLTVSSTADFPTSVPFVIQVDSERMLVTAVAGNQLTVTRGYNSTVATSHTSSAFATMGNFANVHGGGIYNLGTADITQVSLAGNLAQSRGGGLYNAALTGTLSVAVNTVTTTLTLNSVAAFPTTGQFTIQVDGEQMLVTAVNVAANTLTVQRGVGGTVAAAHAGGAFVTSVGENQVDVQQTTFLDNFASSRGAAIYNEEMLDIRNSTLSNNDSGTNAGLANSVSGQVTITNSTVVDNVAYRGGGLTNSQFGSVEVRNTIIANNAVTTVTGVKAPNVRGTFTTQGNNFVGNNAGSTGFVNSTNSDQVGSDTSPFDPVIKAIADNGGGTQTHAARTGSPIIDAGDNTGGDPFDQRGATRPTNTDSDIGAVEQQDIHVTINDVTLKEGNSGSTIFTFTLSLNQPSIQEVRVRYSLQGDTAFAGEDFIDATGEVVFAPNQLNQTLEVIVNGDTTIESDEQFLVNLSISSDAVFTPTLDRTQAVGTILADDTGIRITDVNRVEQESGSPAQDYVFTISVVGALLAPGQTVTVNYNIVDGTAVLGSDYSLSIPASDTLTFTAGPLGELPASQTLTVQVNGDEDIEGNETFNIDLTSPDLPFEFGKATGIGTIFNDDLGFTITGGSTNELDPPNNSTIDFTVALQQRVYEMVGGVPTQATVTANVSTVSGTATAGEDFTPINSQVVTFSGNTTTQTVTATVLGDLRYEPTETFTLQVVGGTVAGNSDGNVVSLSTSGTGTIFDNDPLPDTYRVFFDNNTNEIVVELTDGGTLVTIEIHRTADLVNSFTVFGNTRGVMGVVDVTRDDLFIVDFVTGNPIPLNGLFIDGLDQVAADTLQFDNGGFNTVEYNSTGPDSGSVVFDGSATVTYTGLEPIRDNTSADSRVFNAPAMGNDNIVMSSGGGLTTISSVLTTGSPTFESVTFANPATSLIINANAGDNTIQLSGGDVTFTSSLTVNAGDGNDTINGTSWTLATILNGGLGDDTITGGTSQDFVFGGDGADSINGSGGDDVLFGEAGDDTVDGGEGADFADGGANNDSILGGNGVDTLTGGDDDDFVDGGAGDETVSGGTGNDTVQGGLGADTVVGGDGNDSLSGGDGDDSLDGGFGDDTLSGDAGNDMLNGDAGNDLVVTNGDVDQTLTDTDVTLVGVETDTLIGLSVEGARLIAGSGNNLLDASGFTLGGVTLVGGLGQDTLIGTAFDDVLDGGITNDFTGLDAVIDPLNIMDGADSIDGGDGRDTLNGRGGDDIILGGAGNDCLLGGAGNDFIDAGDDDDNVEGNGGSDSLLGGAGIDTIDGGDSTDTIRGGADGDSLLGGLANDFIDGEDGDDTIDAGDGNDTATGGDGNDSVGGGAGDDTLTGGLGDDSINGNDGNDTLDGNAGADTLFGGSGDDSLISTEGSDQILGQGGIDSFTYNGDATQDDNFTITAVGLGFGPATGIGLARLNLTVFSTNLIGVENFTLNMGGGNDLLTLGDLASVTDLTRLNINAGTGNDTVDGALSTSTTVALSVTLGDGDDSVQGTAASDTVDGGLGADTIIGNDGADSILGGDGNDSLNGNMGNDTILGGTGDDCIFGGGGLDSILGEDGKDSIYGHSGNDTIDGGNHDDFLDGGAGTDSIRGGAGNDQIAGREDADLLYGDAGNDTIKGGTGNDTIDGGTGADLVDGEDDNDFINGGADNDFLLGGNGNDKIVGGAGNDVLVGGLGVDTVDGQGGSRDTVLGGAGTGTNTFQTGDKRTGEVINELFKLTTARPNIFSELNF